MDKILLKAHENHIKNYGFISDLMGITSYGIEKERIKSLLSEGYQIVSEFVEDKTLPKYQVINLDVPYLEIPRGVLYIWAVFPENNYCI